MKHEEITLKTKKEGVLDLYSSVMKEDADFYDEGDIERYVSYAREDVGGWLGQRVLDLLNIVGGILLDVQEEGEYLVITYIKDRRRG